jgi:hypothetical protein
MAPRPFSDHSPLKAPSTRPRFVQRVKILARDDD